MAYAALGDTERAWQLATMINPANHGMYRLLLESLLGLPKEVDKLYVAPRLPAHWQALTIHYHYHYHATVYRLEISQQPRAEGAPCPAGRLMVEGVEPANAVIRLVDDQREHCVQLQL